MARISALIILMVMAPAAACAARALVVFNEPFSASYREAFEGLRAEWAETLETAPADRALPPGPHGVIIALGGRAAMRAGRDGAPLVVASIRFWDSSGATRKDGRSDGIRTPE